MYVSDDKQLRSITHSEPGLCTRCGAPVYVPCIFWLSPAPAADVWLHPSCSLPFTLGIARDAHEHKLRSGKDIGFLE